MKKIILYILVAAVAGGCAGHKFRSPEVSVPGRYVYGAGDTVAAPKIDTAWWTIFSDTTLTRLISTALANNQDVAIAASRVVQAQAQGRIARAQFLPGISIGANAEGNYNDLQPGGIVQQYSVQPSVSWEIGFFGKMQRSSEAAKAQYMGSVYAMQAAKLSLAAQVAESYFLLRQYQLNLDISTLSYALRGQSTAMIDSMFTRGLSSGVDLEQSRSLTATAAAAIPQYRRAAVQTSLGLDVLLGHAPTPLPVDDIAARFGFSMDSIGIYLSAAKLERANEVLHTKMLTIQTIDSLMAAVPAGIPSSLLERRPDVLEAYQNAAYTSAQAGLARAARYPSITLTGEAGIASTTLRGLTSGNPFVWSASLDLFQPLIGYGALKRQEQVAREAARQAVLEYEKAVMTALSEVENALVSISTYRTQSARLRELLRANIATKIMTDALYRNGMVGYLDVLDADRSLYTSQTLYVNLVAQQFTAYVELFKALGGGWD